MLFAPPVLLRRKRILTKLKECGAFSPKSAVTFKEAGVFHPDAFPGVTQKLMDENMVKTTRDGKYYLNISERGAGPRRR